MNHGHQFQGVVGFIVAEVLDGWLVEEAGPVCKVHFNRDPHINLVIKKADIILAVLSSYLDVHGVVTDGGILWQEV